VVEDGSDLIFVVDYHGEILYHNDSVTETLGYLKNSLIGKNFFDYLLPSSLPQFKKKYAQSTKKPFQKAVEFQFLCRNNLYKFLEFNSINLKQKENLEGLILDCRDITQRKRDAEEMLQLQKAKELFLANISHEIRTPINGIAGMATLLSQNPTREEQVTYLNAIKSAADNLKVIINDILDLASIESGKLKFEKIGFCLKDLLSSLLDTFSVQAMEKGVQLMLNIDSEADKIVVGDPVRLNQILINLISNAIKFTPSGSIKLSCRVVGHSKGKLFFEFEVKDTGIGIPKEKLSSIFERFSQADASITRKYGGTGLGLTIVKQLVDLQHGQISVQSTDDKGSTFTVVIPYPLGSMDHIANSSLKANHSQTFKSSLKNLNVLLVEDNDINRLYASSILKTWHCNITAAENGFVALEKIKNENFDIILMDLQMPVMDGYEATKAIRLQDSPKGKVPVIALTANATRGEIEKCRAAGMNDCIAKPFTPEDLFGMLIKHMHTHESDETSLEDIPSRHRWVNLSYLRSVSNNDTAFIKEMIETFLVSMPRTLEEMHAFVEKKDWKSVGKTIHKIKPSLSMIGMHALKTHATELEELCNLEKHDSRNLQSRMKLFTSKLDQVLNELEGLRGTFDK
jgi:PAS domain S-box-containing protein